VFFLRPVNAGEQDHTPAPVIRSQRLDHGYAHFVGRRQAEVQLPRSPTTASIVRDDLLDTAYETARRARQEAPKTSPLISPELSDVIGPPQRVEKRPSHPLSFQIGHRTRRSWCCSSRICSRTELGHLQLAVATHAPVALEPLSPAPRPHARRPRCGRRTRWGLPGRAGEPPRA
jgi:hypothetical protein